ncbi:IS3 family transposase [Streptomyces sp. NPDC127103]|uniref:IS3 family transposase n=1 Tax=Streptomyces sp. NPDC127103 TaxID=3347139 RepID=UPI00365C55B1
MTGRWGFISVNRADFGAQRICRALGLSRSGLYRWLAGAEAREVRRADGDTLVAGNREIHADHRGTYGVRRVHAELRGFGHTVDPTTAGPDRITLSGPAARSRLLTS